MKLFQNMLGFLHIWYHIECYSMLHKSFKTWKQEETCMAKKYVMVNFFFTNILDELDVYCKL